MASVLAMPASRPGQRLRSALASLAGATALGERVRAIILAGSLARGEGSWMRDGQGWRLLGDVDVLLVARDDRHPPGADQLAEWKAGAEAAAAAAGLSVSVSLNLAFARHLQALPPHIFGYELRETGKVIWGAPDVLQTVPPVSPGMIPLEDAWRLLANRIVELLPYRDGGDGAAASPHDIYPWIKLYLDMATSYLVFVRNYQPSYAARVHCLRECARRRTTASAEGSFITPAFVEQVAACTAWKLSPASACPRLAQPGFRRQAVADADALWRWELARLTGAPAGLPRAELWSRWLSRQRRRDRWRGWASAFRHGGRGAWRLWPRWFALAGVASPRTLVYEAATELLFTGRCERPRLPVPADGQPLPACLLDNFQRFVANTLS